MARTPGKFIFPGSLEVESAEALDKRTQVESYSDLISTIGTTFYYQGINVTVTKDTDVSKRGIYRLNEMPSTVAANWKKIAEGDSINAVQYIPQSLTELEKAQAKINIGVPNALYSMEDTNLNFLRKTSLEIGSSNVFDKESNDIMPGHYSDPYTGSLISDANYEACWIFQVTTGSIVRAPFLSANTCTYYDYANNYIGGFRLGTDSTTVPSSFTIGTNPVSDGSEGSAGEYFIEGKSANDINSFRLNYDTTVISRDQMMITVNTPYPAEYEEYVPKSTVITSEELTVLDRNIQDNSIAIIKIKNSDKIIITDEQAIPADEILQVKKNLHVDNAFQGSQEQWDLMDPVEKSKYDILYIEVV